MEALGEFLDPMIGQWRGLDVIFPLGGFIFGAEHRQVGPVDGDSIGAEASVATMMWQAMSEAWQRLR